MYDLKNNTLPSDLTLNSWINILNLVKL